ncbi:MAG: hypothetical protein IPJ67_03800 [Candidatus Moraniibacteriota bacterium]|nr:MAG: hypothetical protein IPJ67_03800 [Candidatus Moranbacteria bacterium]
MTKKLIFFFLIVGSSVGGYVPVLWGGSVFSIASIFWSMIGGFVGIYVGFVIGRKLE